MKNAITLVALSAMLSACVTMQQSGPAAWGYQPGQQAPSVISEVEAETLTAQVIEIKAKRKEFHDSMFSVRDPATRAQRQRAIDEFTQQLQPLEYRLRSAGRPIPPG